MAVTRRTRRPRGSRMKTRTGRYARRRAGPFGLYRSTRFATLRSVARRLGRVTSIARTPFPQTKFVAHKMVHILTVPQPTNAGDAQVVQTLANGIFQPGHSYTAHQPMFRDEMAAQYTHYTVLSSKIKIEVTGTTGVNDQEVVFSLWCDDNDTIPSTLSDIMEQHSHTIDRLDRRNKPKRISGWFDAAKWAKTTRAGILADSDKKIAKTANPSTAESKFFTLIMAPLNNSVKLNAITLKIQVVYNTMWREPVDHIGS